MVAKRPGKRKLQGIVIREAAALIDALLAKTLRSKQVFFHPIKKYRCENPDPPKIVHLSIKSLPLQAALDFPPS